MKHEDDQTAGFFIDLGVVEDFKDAYKRSKKVISGGCIK